MRFRSIVALITMAVWSLAPHGPRASIAHAAGTCLPSSPRATGSYRALVASNNSFGFRLLRAVVSGNSDNAFLSPVSAALALEMTYGGALGETKQVMAATLGLKALPARDVRTQAASLLASFGSADPRVQLQIANSLWARAGVQFQSTFLHNTLNSFGAKANVADFAALSTVIRINAWVSCATRGTIPTIVDHIPPQVIMYLLNTVYFHGDWSSPFENTRTASRAFTTGTGAVLHIPFMHGSHSFPYADVGGTQLVSLPYGNGRFNLTVVLPASGAAVKGVIARLSNPTWRTWVRAEKVTPVDLLMPRFTIQNTFDLKPVLSHMGMAQAFSNRANFLGMCASSCTISDVIHKTILRVDEKGTTAAAVTSISMQPTAIQAGHPPIQLSIDHPFVLALTDSTTGSILFLGAINHPAG